MPYIFVVREVSRMNILNIVFGDSIELYACSAVNANGEGVGTASAFACVLNRYNVKELYKAKCRRYQSMHLIFRHNNILF